MTDITVATFLTPFSQSPNIQEEPEVLLACSAFMPKICVQRVSSYAPNQKQKQDQQNRDLYNLHADRPRKCQTRPFLLQLVNKWQLTISQVSRDWALLEGRLSLPFYSSFKLQGDYIWHLKKYCLTASWALTRWWSGDLCWSTHLSSNKPRTRVRGEDSTATPTQEGALCGVSGTLWIKVKSGSKQKCVLKIVSHRPALLFSLWSQAWLSATRRPAACPPSLSPAVSWSPLSLMSVQSAMPSSHLMLCHPFLLLPLNFPRIRVFSNESTLYIRWPKFWSFPSSLSSEYSGLISFEIDWFDLLAFQETLKSLLQHNSAALSLLYGPTLSSIHDYWESCSFDQTDLCQQSDISPF